MKIKMDQMAREFGDMLKETLDKMSKLFIKSENFMTKIIIYIFYLK